MDHNKQSIGETLLSKRVVGYRVNFRDKDNDYRTIEVQIKSQPQLDIAISTTLSNNIKRRIYNANFSSRFLKTGFEDPPYFKATAGTIASADHLISCYPVKCRILETIKPEEPLIGGEMEAVGILKTLEFRNTDHIPQWMVIKSICDWGALKNFSSPFDGITSERLKDSLQAYAMMNSVSVFVELLRDSLWG
jgi:hypothetical protein